MQTKYVHTGRQSHVCNILFPLEIKETLFEVVIRNKKSSRILESSPVFSILLFYSFDNREISSLEGPPGGSLRARYLEECQFRKMDRSERRLREGSISYITLKACYFDV